jgi:hypothetical protein
MRGGLTKLYSVDVGLSAWLVMYVCMYVCMYVHTYINLWTVDLATKNAPKQ